MSTAAFYGLGRDFSKFSAFSFLTKPAAEEIHIAPKKKHKSGAQKRKAAQIASGKPTKTLTEQVLRVNPHSPICEPSGFAKHKAEIRAEMRKTKAASGAN